jgi:amino acid adenylation domain-containing protein
MITLLQRYLTHQAQSQPDRPAIVYRDEQLTYGQLEADSNRLARLLTEAGCRRGDRVCLLMPKSPTAIVTILGILKADCAYVPLDPAGPAPRLSMIIDACGPRLILAGGPVGPLLDELMADAARRATLSIGWMGPARAAGHNFQSRFSLDDLSNYSHAELEYRNGIHDPAHILFTSGSTGVPKGVVITHSNVSHFVDWAVRHFAIETSDRISSHPPLHFDLSTFDLYGTLCGGAQLHIVPAELNLLPHKLAEFIRRCELTQWFSVPSVLNFMATASVVDYADFPKLKRLLWCGEVLRTPTLIYWMKRLPHVRFTNLYGPTEATIASSFHSVPECPRDDSAQIPIGRACDGEELFVLDEGLEPSPAGEVGDLYIAGVGLSPGYWQDPQKTDQVFITAVAHGQIKRIYKTGDMARIGPDGLVYFLGRADSQVKSRGYRIELGEIETALSALNLTAECAIVAIDTAGFEGAAICCAYAPLPNFDAPPQRLRSELRKSLPAYMMPAHWARLERLPKNANGKIDRRALTEQFQNESHGVK